MSEKPTGDPLDFVRSFAESFNSAVIVTTADLDPPGPRILYVNPAFTRITKYRPEDVLGKTPRILQGPKSDRAVLDHMRRTLPQEHSFFGQIVNYDKNGDEIQFDWHISAIYDAEGRPSHWVSLQHDITGTTLTDVEPPLKALIVHQNNLTRIGLHSFLKKARPQVSVDESTDYRTALERDLSAAGYDLVIAQWAPPGCGGEADLKALCKAVQPAPLAVISASEAVGDVRTAFLAGALAFIPESTESDILAEIFRLVLAGGTYIPWPLTGVAEASEPEPRHGESGLAGLAHLTRRQRQIVQLLAEGLSNDEIGKRLGLKAPTVKAHVSRTLRALGTKSRLQAALWFKQQVQESGPGAGHIGDRGQSR